MELEGFIRCKDTLAAKGIPVSVLTTDRHVSINAWVKKNWPEVKHYFDTWHISKSVTKKLKKASAAKVSNRQIGRWVPAIVNHLFKVVQDTDPGNPLRKEWWKSVCNHVCNVHVHDSDCFPACRHGELQEEKVVDGQVYVRDWIDPDSEAASELRKVLWNDRLLQDLDRASYESTSELEGFHSALNRNAPKMEGFSYSGMLSKVLITVLHHNENCQRPVKLNRDGTPARRVQRSKATGQKPTVQYVREPATYDWMDKLYVELDKAIRSEAPKKSGISYNDPKPATLASKGESYDSLDALEEKTDKRRRGEVSGLKPHFVEFENVEQRRVAGSTHGRRGRPRGGASTRQPHKP